MIETITSRDKKKIGTESYYLAGLEHSFWSIQASVLVAEYPGLHDTPEDFFPAILEYRILST